MKLSKKLLSLILLGFLFTSCSGAKLYRQGVSKINKAIAKDPSIKFPSDTVLQLSTDTIIDTVDNIITKTVTNTVTKTVNICDFDEELAKSNTQLRIEKRMAKDSLDHLEKMYKLETNRLKNLLNKQNRSRKIESKQLGEYYNTMIKLAKEKTKQERGNWITRLLGRYWWIVFIIGLIVGLYGKQIFKKITRLLKTVI